MKLIKRNAINSIAFNHKKVKACYTTRHGGYSSGSYSTFNLALHVNDLKSDVLKNRQKLNSFFDSSKLIFMNQIHGNEIGCVTRDNAENLQSVDALITCEQNLALCVMTADCLPLLLAGNNCVAAVHCGWRSLASNIVEKTVEKMQKLGSSGFEFFIGACILQNSFEVGSEVYDKFCIEDHNLKSFFVKYHDKYLCDLEGICIYKLNKLKITTGTCLHEDTYTNTIDFFSYRKEHTTGRQVCAIELKNL